MTKPEWYGDGPEQVNIWHILATVASAVIFFVLLAICL